MGDRKTGGLRALLVLGLLGAAAAADLRVRMKDGRIERVD